MLVCCGSSGNTGGYSIPFPPSACNVKRDQVLFWGAFALKSHAETSAYILVLTLKEGGSRAKRIMRLERLALMINRNM